MSWFGGGFKAEKMKPYLKMAMQRITIKTNQKTVSVKKSKKEVAALLKASAVLAFSLCPRAPA